MVAINFSDIFKFSHVSKTRRPAYKLFKSQSNNSTRYMFFAEKVVSVWNSLPASVNFSTLCSFSFHQFSKIRINRHFHCSVIVILFCILFLFSFSMLHVLWLKVYSVSSVLVLFRAAVSAIVALLSCSRRTLYNYCHFIANLSKIKID